MSLAPGRPKQARTAAREGEGLSSNTPVRVVLDTNVVLSALVFGGGAAGRVRRAWQQGAILPLASIATVQELVRVLAYPKFRLAQVEQGELLADSLPYAETVRIPRPP
ncbi:MAG: PIN domain nuclease, partial [Burkholderiales bacterium PBB4]